MGLFRSKPKVSIEDCCKQFYDSQIFHTTVAGVDMWSSYLETISKSVIEADPSFSAVDPNLFRQEMMALRIEEFSLVCSRKVKRDDLAVRQSFFTRRYLDENGRVDIWDIMGEYNQAIAQSAHLTEHGERVGKGRWDSINKLRTDMFVKWAETNVGNPESMTEEQAQCVARVANRIGADMRRADCIAVKLLAARLADRLGCANLKTEALFLLETAIFGFYTGAEEYLNPVSLQ